jgi:hypothetical protein
VHRRASDAVGTLDAARPLDEGNRISEELATLRAGRSALLQEYAHSLEGRSGRGWPPADRLVVWVMARAAKSALPGEVVSGLVPRDPAAGTASPSRFGDVKAGRAVQPVPEGSNEAEVKDDVREEICA